MRWRVVGCEASRHSGAKVEERKLDAKPHHHPTPPFHQLAGQPPWQCTSLRDRIHRYIIRDTWIHGYGENCIRAMRLRPTPILISPHRPPPFRPPLRYHQPGSLPPLSIIADAALTFPPGLALPPTHFYVLFSALAGEFFLSNFDYPIIANYNVFAFFLICARFFKKVFQN